MLYGSAHGEKILEMDNLCILQLCFEYVDSEKNNRQRQADQKETAEVWKTSGSKADS